MQFRSTNNPEHVVDARTAILNGLAPDGGLYVPVRMPTLPPSFFERLPRLSFSDIAFEVAAQFLEDHVPRNVLRKIADDAFNFSVPLVHLDAQTAVLELFHGPTFAFKDFGARFMARLMGYFVENAEKELVVLVATSGDTGSAVAHGFLGVPGIRVVVLYPSGKVSPLQEKMLTTMGGNVTALEVQGTFDDCQRLVKAAFVDAELTAKLFLTSANSISIARLIPQSFYYFYAYGQIPLSDVPVVMVVPSGNFGNVTAGLYAKKMGLPVARFIAATNANAVVPEYYTSGVFQLRPSIATLSNAMDVGNPSNFARIQHLYPTVESLRKDFWTTSVTDQETQDAIRFLFTQHGYVSDPHGAVGFCGFQRYREQVTPAVHGVILETAHPAKFLETVEPLIGKKIAIPSVLQSYLTKKKNAILLPADFTVLKEFLLDF